MSLTQSILESFRSKQALAEKQVMSDEADKLNDRLQKISREISDAEMANDQVALKRLKAERLKVKEAHKKLKAGGKHKVNEATVTTPDPDRMVIKVSGTNSLVIETDGDGLAFTVKDGQHTAMIELDESVKRKLLTWLKTK